MSDKQKVTVYVHKYALTGGIRPMTGTLSPTATGSLFSPDKKENYMGYLSHNDFSLTMEEATAESVKRQSRKIESLNKQLEKLKSLNFNK